MTQQENWARWEKEGEAWREIFRHLDPFLVSFAERYGMELTRWSWDSPDRTLTWSSNGLQRDLHVYIEGEPGHYSLIIEGAAWQDSWDNGKGQRSLWTEKFDDSIPVPARVPEAELRGILVRPVMERLVDARARVDDRRREDLKPWVELSR